MSSNREAAFPTRMTLQVYKARGVGAVKGLELLKKKSDALSARLRALLQPIKATKAAVGAEMTGAAFAISEAVWAAGDFRKKVRCGSLEGGRRVDASASVLSPPALGF